MDNKGGIIRVFVKNFRIKMLKRAKLHINILFAFIEEKRVILF